MSESKRYLAEPMKGAPSRASYGRLDAEDQRARDRWMNERRREAEQNRIGTGLDFLRDAGAPNAQGARADLVPKNLRAWVESWTERPRGCALLAGPFGVGKSMAAQWAIAELWRRGSWDDEDSPRDWRPLATARRIRCVELQRAVYADRIHLIADAWESTGLLVIEDVRRYPESAWRIADEMHGILDARCENGRATILTTNLAPQEFEGAYGSLWSRIHATQPGVITVVRADLRGAA